jgi:hypothetical protein
VRAARWLILAGGLAALVVLFLVLRPGGGPSGTSSSPTLPTEEPTTTDASPAPTPDAREIEIEVEEGRARGPGRVSVALGERVDLKVESDVTDEVHVHGYDLFADVGPDREARIRFRADVPGIFEVELESAGLRLLELEVQP